MLKKQIVVPPLLSLVVSTICLVLIGLGSAWIFFAPRSTYLSLQGQIDTQDCVSAQIWTDPWSNPMNQPQNSYHFNYLMTKQQADISVKLTAPIAYFRFDPCNLSDQTLTIYSLNLVYEERTLPIPFSDIAQWDCYNCELALSSNDEIKIITTAQNPYVVSRNFDKYIRELDVTYPRFYPKLRTAITAAFVVTMGFMIAITIWFASRIAFLTIVPAVLLMVSISYLIYIYYWQLVSLFPQPAISQISGIGFVQHQGFPPISDTILFFAPLIGATIWIIGVRLGIYIYEKRR